MRKKEVLRDDYIKVLDKGGEVSIYDIYGRGLKIDSFTTIKDDKYYGFIEKWEVCIIVNNIPTIYKGTDQKSLIETLTKLASDKKRISLRKKEICLIYTDNLIKAKGFLKPIITRNDNKYYFQVLNTIEIRDISYWIDADDVTSVYDIASNAQYMINEIFVPEKYF